MKSTMFTQYRASTVGQGKVRYLRLGVWGIDPRRVPGVLSFVAFLANAEGKAFRCGVGIAVVATSLRGANGRVVGALTTAAAGR